MSMIQLMRIAPVIPVIVIDDVKHAVPMAQALVDGGIRVLEITLRTPAALAAVRAIARGVKDVAVGVGTVTQAHQFNLAHEAGAQFAVSPGLTPALAEAARQSDLYFLPGVMTPTDIIAAVEHGYKALKFFPAQQAGGIAALKAFHATFPDVIFCPTGGITIETASPYLALPNVACVGGSWLTPKALLDTGNWTAINRLALAAAELRRITCRT
ncbi:MAG: bifunctional 4-hydroxy-2-oxoglutarate aldolase/2-dehydro-3-deoxy-phosphogluconate aldolase [Gammaproteobacteria bacterium]|nr:bifunctional 4-hydroxy-2-oxoglutarate aldolase/2-dehydro-3-deoxy-phosphogluconate aldolase [Gammaproteobacteria bacterium]